VFFWQISSLIAALVAIFIIPNYGWRWMFAIGGVVALISAVAWLALPESIRFLIEKGRINEAEAVALRLGAMPSEKMAAGMAPRARTGSLSLLRGAYLVPTLSAWSMQFLSGFVFFGIAVWLPTLLLHMGFSFVNSLLFSGIITGAGAAGNVIGGLCLDRWGRRPTIMAYFFFGGLALIAWGFSDSVASVIIIGATGAFFSFGTAGLLFTYISEIYPTALRASGVGICGAWQRVGGIVAPFILGVLVGAHVAVSIIFTFVGALLLVGGLIAWATVIETKLESLEQIQDDVAAAPMIEGGAAPYQPSM
jgi:putative MFS transporter